MKKTKQMNKKRWKLFEPQEVIASVKVICVSREAIRQKDVKYYVRTICCDMFDILTHEQIYDRGRRGAKICQVCAKKREWRHRKKKPREIKVEIIDKTAIWPAPQSQIGVRWYGRIL